MPHGNHLVESLTKNLENMKQCYFLPNIFVINDPFMLKVVLSVSRSFHTFTSSLQERG